LGQLAAGCAERSATACAPGLGVAVSPGKGPRDQLTAPVPCAGRCLSKAERTAGQAGRGTCIKVLPGDIATPPGPSRPGSLDNGKRYVTLPVLVRADLLALVRQYLWHVWIRKI
jgi:hypothetical protein